MDSLRAFKLGKDWRFHKEALLRWTKEQKPRGGSATVLIVDDEASVCRVLSRLVQRAGLRAYVATTGSVGLDLVFHEAPDLILLDLVLPDMNGPRFLEELRKIHPDLPVVLITGYPDSELMHQAAQFGPLMLLAKPVDRTQLESAVQIALGEKAGRRADELRGKQRGGEWQLR